MKTVYPQIVTSADMLKSTIQLEQLTQKLKQNNAQAAAITNSKLYGLLPFGMHYMHNRLNLYSDSLSMSN